MFTALLGAGSAFSSPLEPMLSVHAVDLGNSTLISLLNSISYLQILILPHFFTSAAATSNSDRHSLLDSGVEILSKQHALFANLTGLAIRGCDFSSWTSLPEQPIWEALAKAAVSQGRLKVLNFVYASARPCFRFSGITSKGFYVLRLRNACGVLRQANHYS